MLRVNKLKIALLAPFEEQVPPRTYGGTERVVSNLANNLVTMGHDVTLFASGNSHTKAKLVACTNRSIRTLPESRDPDTRAMLNWQGLAKALESLSVGKFDIVHNHYGWQPLMLKSFIKQPLVTTLHGNLSISSDHKAYGFHKKEYYVSISKSQRQYLKNLHYVATIYNGISPNQFSFNDKPDEYLVFLGRIHPHKGPDKAIKIAKKTGYKLIIAAKVDPLEDEYFKKKIQPLIDGKQIVYVGEVNHRQKVKLLKNAKAMLAPIQWDEPFGITNIEALACGTPVIAIGRGALTEIIVDGKSGYLCKNVSQMLQKVTKIDKIDRAYCRQQVIEKFSSERMAEKYLMVYQRILAKK